MSSNPLKEINLAMTLLVLMENKVCYTYLTELNWTNQIQMNEGGPADCDCDCDH